MNPELHDFPRYATILKGEAQSSYLTCKNTKIQFTDAMTLKELWIIHSQDHQKTHGKEKNHTLLDLKRTIAERLITSCILCEHRCHTDRTKNPGACRTQETRIACEFLHTGEERVLVPSHTIFFSGCPLHCVFCQNWDISQTATGAIIPPRELAAIITQRANQGSRNVNWVGGDPTPNLPYILEVLSHLTISIPQVWNSNMYCSMETMKLLSNVMDLYLTDFKFGNDDCARRLAHADRYVEIVQRNHLIAAQTGDVLVRHLVLPNHVECCSKPILDWLGENLPTAAINIMAQYHPEYQAKEYPEISSPLSMKEYQGVLDYAKELGLRVL